MQGDLEGHVAAAGGRDGASRRRSRPTVHQDRQTGLPEKQSIDMVLLTPENACQYERFAPIEGAEPCAPVSGTAPTSETTEPAG